MSDVSNPLAPDGGAAPLAVDLDGDTVPDVAALDIDGDNVSDAIIKADDRGGMTTWIELDGHPGWDALARDFDADGLVDAYMQDRDGDGYYEYVALADGTEIQFDPSSSEVVAVTAPGGADPAAPAPEAVLPDADPDAATPWAAPAAADPTVPQDQSPSPEPPEIAPVDEATPWAAPDASQNPIQSPIQAPVVVPLDETPVVPVEPADSAVIDPAAIDPAPALTVWGDTENELWTAQYQSTNGFCAPVSVAMIVSEFEGRYVPEQETVDIARNNGWLTYSEGGQFDGWSGLTTPQTLALMETYGVDAHVEGGHDTGETAAQAMDRLRLHRQADHGIVLMVDGDEIWTRGLGDDVTDAGVDANHAIIIRAIDDVNGTVILGDPGNPNGGEYWVMTQADFAEAWDDSGFECVVTDEAPATGESSALATNEAGRLVGSRVSATGWVILPVLLAGKKLLQRIA